MEYLFLIVRSRICSECSFLLWFEYGITICPLCHFFHGIWCYCMIHVRDLHASNCMILGKSILIAIHHGLEEDILCHLVADGPMVHGIRGTAQEAVGDIGPLAVEKEIPG